jgi:3-deoxy-7-phosphoheptulonate synthase
VGADGLLIEAHNDPARALSDGAQSLDLSEFDELMRDLRARTALEGREMGGIA